MPRWRANGSHRGIKTKTGRMGFGLGYMIDSNVGKLFKLFTNY